MDVAMRTTQPLRQTDREQCRVKRLRSLVEPPCPTSIQTR
jgi:hypothetical protein